MVFHLVDCGTNTAFSTSLWLERILGESSLACCCSKSKPKQSIKSYIILRSSNSIVISHSWKSMQIITFCMFDYHVNKFSAQSKLKQNKTKNTELEQCAKALMIAFVLIE